MVPTQDGSCGAQDGGDHEASQQGKPLPPPYPYSNSSCCPSSNPFLPSPNPFLPPDPAFPFFTPPSPSAPPSSSVAPPHAPPPPQALPPCPTHWAGPLPSVPAPGSHGTPDPAPSCPLPLGSGSHGRPSWPDFSHGPGTGAEGKEGTPEPAESIMAAPVTYHRNRGGGNPRIQWSPVPRSLIKELVKALKEHGGQSRYFRGLLEASLLESELVPADLRQIFSCLLDVARYSRWEAMWEMAVADILPQLWEDPEVGEDTEGEKLTVNHLCGLGEWEKGDKQARLIPTEALKRSTQVALQSFYRVAAGVPSVPVSHLFQGPTENFDDFVVRLQQAAESEEPDEGARKKMVTLLATTNANPACKAAIMSLPLHPRPTLRDLLMVCAAKVTSQTSGEKSSTPSIARRVSFADLQGTVAAAASSPSVHRSGPGTPRTGRPSTSACHLCQKEDHWMPDCPLRKEFYAFKRAQQSGVQGGEAPKNS